MRPNTVYTLLIFAHVLSEFYLQSDKNAEKVMRKRIEPSIKTEDTTGIENEREKILLFHYFVYSASMAVVIYIGLIYGLPFNKNIIRLWVFLSVSHCYIDWFKGFLLKLKCMAKFEKFNLINDQILHLLLISITWAVFGRDLQVNGFIEFKSKILPDVPVYLLVLGVLLVIRPVGRLIKSNEVFDLAKKSDFPSDDEKKKDNAGQMVGYLERIIVFFLLILKAYTAIAFVISAKSIIRFPEIKKAEDDGKSEDGTNAKVNKAEYFLIGTLMSMASTFLIVALLGLI
jgi:hypothetical protein